MKIKMAKGIAGFLLVLAELAFKEDDKVYICLSSGATKYHSHYCQGLKKCNHEVKKVTVKEAVKLGYSSCGYCY